MWKDPEAVMLSRRVNCSIMGSVIQFFLKRDLCVCVDMYVSVLRRGPGGNTSIHGQWFLVGGVEWAWKSGGKGKEFLLPPIYVTVFLECGTMRM